MQPKLIVRLVKPRSKYFSTLIAMSVLQASMNGFILSATFAKNSITSLSLPVNVLYWVYLPGLGSALQSNTKPPPFPLLSVGMACL